MKLAFFAAMWVAMILAGCGPTAEEQHAMDVQKCAGLGLHLELTRLRIA